MSAIDTPDPQAGTARSGAQSGFQPGSGPMPAARPGRVRSRRSFPTLRTVTALMLREMTTSYGRNPGGYLWAVLEPALGTMLIAFIFSLGFRTPSLGTHFGLFIATGLLPFMMWAHLTSKIGSAINYSKALLVYPSVTFLDAILARFLLNALTQLMVSYLVLSFILVVLDVPASIRVDRIALGYAMALALGLGFGVINCFVFSMVPVWQQVWSILTRPLFFLSGVIFLFDSFPQPYRDWLWWNPLIHVTGAVRAGFYARYDAPYVHPIYVFALSALLLAAGLMFLRRYHSDILNQ